MIEVVHVEALGASLKLCRSESGGWEQNGRVLPWCGVTGHGHPGLAGFKLFAGDWMIGLYALRGRALSRAVVGLRALAGRAAGYLAVLALLVLLYLAASGCASAPALVQVAPPVAPVVRADCEEPPVATSTPAPDASCATIREAWSIQRSNAIRWEGLAKKRAAKLDDARREVADVRAELARAHERLVEAPPPAPEERGNPLLRVLVPFGGAALAGGVAALVCDEVECKPSVDALAVALSSGVAAGLGALLVEVTE